MLDFFNEICNISGIERTSPASFHREGDAMTEKTNRTIKESLPSISATIKMIGIVV